MICVNAAAEPKWLPAKSHVGIQEVGMLFPRLRLLLPNETDAVQTLSRVLVEELAGGTASDYSEKGF
ncbi:hypothetical protein ACVWY2_000006 [Bradyrhizobium sp. JR6.1]